MNDRSTDKQLPARTAAREQTTLRAEKKERTRSLLIEAAADVIFERGFHAASLMEITSRAGLTTGAVYSNFRNKENLFLAVIQETAMPPDLGPETSAPWERLGHAAVTAARGVDLPATRRLFKLQLEFALLTLGNPVLMQTFVDDLRADRHELATLLSTNSATPRPQFSPSPDQLATVFTAVLQGLVQHRFLDRDSVPEELVSWTVQALLYVNTREGSGKPER